MCRIKNILFFYGKSCPFERMSHGVIHVQRIIRTKVASKISKRIDMANQLKKIFLIIATMVLIVAIGTAFPSIPTYDPGGMPNIPPVIWPSNPGSTSSSADPNSPTSGIPDMNSIFGSWPPVQTPTESPYNEAGTSAGLDHPAQGPQAEIPAFEPSANTGNIVATTGEKQVLESRT